MEWEVMNQHGAIDRWIRTARDQEQVERPASLVFERRWALNDRRCSEEPRDLCFIVGTVSSPLSGTGNVP